MMKFNNKMKWLAAVSILAVGIPVASYAAQGENQYQANSATPTQQTQNATVDVKKVDNTVPTNTQVTIDQTSQQASQQTTTQTTQQATQPTTQQATWQVTQAPASSKVAQQTTGSSTVPGYHYGHTGMNDGYHHQGHTGMNDGYHNNGTHHNNAPTAPSNQNTVNTANPGYHNGHTGMNDGYYGNMGMEHSQHGMGGHE